MASNLVILSLLSTLKPICFPNLRQSGVSTKQSATQRLYWYGGQCIFGANHRKHYTVCAHECYCSQFTCQSRSSCSFLSKSLPTVGQGCWMHPGSLPETLLCSMPIVTVLMEILYIQNVCVTTQDQPIEPVEFPHNGTQLKNPKSLALMLY